MLKRSVSWYSEDVGIVGSNPARSGRFFSMYFLSTNIIFKKLEKLFHKKNFLKNHGEGTHITYDI